MHSFAQKPRASGEAKPQVPGRARYGDSQKANSIVHLQRTIGNQGVQRLLRGIAEKEINDQQTDPVAEQVLETAESPARHWQAARLPTISSGSKRSNSTEGHLPATVHAAIRAPGQPLEPATRANMESRFGHDFSNVRVHADARAAESAAAVRATAFTVGQDVILGGGQPRPETPDGRQLLAHELVHVVQQRRGGTVPIPNRTAPHEREADTVADAFAAGAPLPALTQGTAVGAAFHPDDKGMTAAHAAGAMGERDAAFILGQRGFDIIIGPAGPSGHQLTAPGLDIVAYNPQTDETWVVDNKPSGGTSTVQGASAIAKKWFQ